MRHLASSYDFDFSLQRFLQAQELSLFDVEAVKLVLTGSSLIDWHRMNFRSRDEIDNFLRVNQFDPELAEDKRRMLYLHQEAIQYLRNYFNLRFPSALLEVEDVRDLFLHASFPEKRFHRLQVLSCVILKVMSIIHHIESRSLLFRTPISDFDLFELVQERVDSFSETAQRAGVPIVQISGSRKSRDSLITKLLSKKDTLAAAIYDKVRYRIVVEHYNDLLPVLAYLTHTFVPFNFTIPNASNNNLLNFDEYLLSRVDLHPRMDGVLTNYRLGTEEPSPSPVNIFSGSTYKMVNFIVDLPVRIDAFLSQEEIMQYGRIAFVMVEFQMIDQDTEAQNEQGENNHELYKQRQRERVLERLRWGGLLKGLRPRKPLSEKEDAF